MGNRLEGKVAIVTGGSRGVGKAVALALAREGADIVVAAKTATPNERLPGTIGETAAEVEKLGRRALAVPCNVREFQDVERLRDDTLRAFGRIDVLINNAGAIFVADTGDWPAGKFDLVMDVNVRGAFLCSRAVLPQMREQRSGHIVMMSPPVSINKVAGKAPYLVSKMGMTMLAHAIAQEERAHGVAANALWPVTMIESQATRHFELGKPEEWRKAAILADATVEICCAPPAELTGRALYDEEVLRERRGDTDFARYAVVPGTTPPPVCREMVE
jgi:citronellol/citronellal dehydrogenase